MARGISNRETMLKAALALFNNKGTGPVTTNHIAKAAGVSPGNLYYHFRNKAEIIRELYERFLEEYRTMWDQLTRGPLEARSVLLALVDGFSINSKYRFFAIELTALCHQDAVLMTRQREVYTARFALLRQVVRRGEEKGIFIAEPDSEIYADILHVVWLINQYWLSYLSLLPGPATDAELQRGVRIALRVILPYLRPDFRDMVNRFLTEGA